MAFHGSLRSKITATATSLTLLCLGSCNELTTGALGHRATAATFPQLCLDVDEHASGETMTEGPEPTTSKLLAHLIISKTNAIRTDQGNTNPLQCDRGLNKIAADHSAELARRETLTHVGRNGNTPLERVRLYYPGFHGLVAENVAYRTIRVDRSQKELLWTPDPSTRIRLADWFINIWANSPTHRANMLDTKVTHIGVGIARKGSRLYVTQLFAGPITLSSF